MGRPVTSWPNLRSVLSPVAPNCTEHRLASSLVFCHQMDDKMRCEFAASKLWLRQQILHDMTMHVG
jgi:hypothetical protein